MAVGRPKTHGDTINSGMSPEYRAWSSMRTRCRNPNAAKFHIYGGRGIDICKRWEKFESFLADMGRKPSPSHSLDRKNNNRGYSPSNCRWATSSEQNRNRSSNRFVKVNGKKVLLIDAANAAGIKPDTVKSRMFLYGWSAKKALSVPARKLANRRIPQCVRICQSLT